MATPVTAPMVGKILKVEKNVGDQVEEDDVVIVMEAMKMEIPVVAPVSGTLKEIKTSPGQSVEAGDVLAEIEESPISSSESPPFTDPERRFRSMSEPAGCANHLNLLLPSSSVITSGVVRRASRVSHDDGKESRYREEARRA